MSLRFPGHPCDGRSKCLSHKHPGRVWHPGVPVSPKGFGVVAAALWGLGELRSVPHRVGTARTAPAPPRSSSGCSCCPCPATGCVLHAVTNEGEFLSEGLLLRRLLGLRGGWLKKGALAYGGETVCQHCCLLRGDSVRGSMRGACRVPAARFPFAIEASGTGWEEVVRASTWLSSRFSH